MQEISQDKKTALLKAALDLFSEKGVHNTPMSQIAERAKIGVGTIYRYFSSKDVLIDSLYQEIHKRIIPEIRKDYSENNDVRENFLLYFGNFIRYLMKHSSELSLMEQYDNHPQKSIRREMNSDSSEMGYGVIFKRAKDESLLKELPFEMLGSIILGMVISLAKFYLSNDGDDSSIHSGAEMIWDAIKK